MKTAISIPDSDFGYFERVVARLGMNRSEFFRRAGCRFLEELESEGHSNVHPARAAASRRLATGVAISGASNAPTLLFLRTDDDVPGAGTLHFDLCPTDGGQMEELERLLSLGAMPTDVVPSGSWLVLADPEGNTFCLMARRIAPEPEDFHD